MASNVSLKWGWFVLLLAAAAAGGAATATFVKRLPYAPARADGPTPAPVQAVPAAEQYQCPMHPAVIQDRPGTCPICGMKLVKVAPTKPKSQERKPLFYRSPMDPKHTSPVPTKDSMGMDYLPVYEEDSPPRSEVDGLAIVDIDASRQRLIGLKTALVDRGAVDSSLRLVARVAQDETRVRRINLKVGGFIEKIFVNFVGQTVRKGQPLFSLYSPEILEAEDELLLALRASEARPEGGAELLRKATRKKLELWGIPAAELERLEREKVASSVVTFVSPVSGTVTSKEIVEGSRVEMGAMPYELVDLSTVWVWADIYEMDLRFVSPGLSASLRLDAWPGRAWRGEVLFLDPVLDAKTRTARVRLAFANPNGELRPEMFGEVTLTRPPRQTIRAPTDAIVQSGTQQIVFVAQGEGHFEPRLVQVGEVGRDFAEVLSGLEPGDAVVTRANFLIDSESSLRASLSRMSGGDAGAPAHPETPR